MTPNNDIEDEALGRWLVNDMPEDERIAFEASDDFQTYKLISSYASELEPPSYDMEAAYAKLRARTDEKKSGKLVKMNLYKRLALAASILVLVGIGSFFILNNSLIQTIKHTTAQGQVKTVKLPDHSLIEMNNLTTVTYNESLWDEQRDVELKGEAFFKVTKGKPFRVLMENGMIEVLGTSFNIKDRNYGTEIFCFTGKVRVTDSKSNALILTEGMSAQIKKGTLLLKKTEEALKTPLWKQGLSRFENAPLEDVIYELQGQFNIEINVNQNISDRFYFGSYPHDNLDQALELVFGSMQLDYVKESDSLIVVK